MAIQQPRWALLVALALAVVPRAGHAQSAQPEWTTPVYRPPAAPATPPPAPPAPPPPASSPPPPAQTAPPPPGYAPGSAPPAHVPPGYAPGYGPPAYVPPAPPQPPPAPVHAGFFLRLHLGVGLNSLASSSSTTGTTQISGPGASLAIALGGAVAPNLAVFGTFFETGPGGPASVKTMRTDLATTDNAGLGGLGAGVVYYLEPLNVYLSGALALTALIVNDVKQKTLDKTGGGIGFEGMVGKEWWVSHHWGLGAAIEIVAATGMKDKNDPSAKWTAEAFNVVFSATYF